MLKHVKSLVSLMLRAFMKRFELKTAFLARRCVPQRLPTIGGSFLSGVSYPYVLWILSGCYLTFISACVAFHGVVAGAKMAPREEQMKTFVETGV
jgi:hypothetical protein